MFVFGFICGVGVLLATEIVILFVTAIHMQDKNRVNDYELNIDKNDKV